MWIGYFLLLLSLTGQVWATDGYGRNRTAKRHTVNKFINTVPIMFKGEFFCSGTFIAPRFVLTSAKCIKKHSADKYKVIQTELPLHIHAARSSKEVFSVKEVFREDSKLGLGLLYLMDSATEAGIVRWDTTGRSKPWITQEIVFIAGWEGSDNISEEYYSEEEEEEDVDTEEYLAEEYIDSREFSEEDDYDDDESGYDRYLAAYPVASDKKCKKALNNAQLFCLAPQQAVFCAGFLGGSVITSDGHLLAIIVDVTKCDRLVAARSFSSNSWILRTMSAPIAKLQNKPSANGSTLLVPRAANATSSALRTLPGTIILCAAIYIIDMCSRK